MKNSELINKLQSLDPDCEVTIQILTHVYVNTSYNSFEGKIGEIFEYETFSQKNKKKKITIRADLSHLENKNEKL